MASMQIFIKLVNGQNIPLEVTTTNTVGDLKNLIYSKEGIHPRQQKIVFQNKQLDVADRTLASYNVSNGAVIHLVMTAREITKIFVKTLTGRTITVDVDSEDTVNDVKYKIYNIEKIPIEEQKLIFAGKTLEGDKMINSYNITQNSTVHLVVKVSGEHSLSSAQTSVPSRPVSSQVPLSSRPISSNKPFTMAFPQQTRHAPETMGVPRSAARPHPRSAEILKRQVVMTIQTQSGRRIVLNVSTNESVYGVKQMISNQENIPPDQQMLIYDGNQLQDGRLICEYGITADCTINMMFAATSRMHLFIKTLDGHTFILYPSIYQTVADVKQELGAKENMDTSQHSLVYQGLPLEDHKILKDCNIPTQCTVHMISPQQNTRNVSSNTIPVLVRTLMGDIITLKVNPNDRVIDVKVQLNKLHDYPLDSMKLVIGGVELRDNDNLSEYRLQQDSTLLVTFHTPTESTKVSALNVATNETVQVEGVDLSGPVQVLREEIVKNLKLTRQQSVMVCNGSVLEADDDYKVDDMSIIEVFPIRSTTIIVGVATVAGVDLGLFQFQSTETVSSLSLAIQESHRVRVQNQVLVYKGSLLTDGQVLEKVFDEGGVHLVTLFIRVGVVCNFGVRLPQGGSINLSMESHHTVGQVKMMLKRESRDQLPHPSQQILRLNGVILQDHYCIGDYLIQESTTPFISLSLLSSNNGNFFIRTKGDKVINLSVDHQATIGYLKLLVARQLGLTSHQSLKVFFCGDLLPDANKIGQFGFTNPCTLFVDY